MDTILLVVLVIAGIGLVTLVLLQHGKGADAGAAFGGGGGGGGASGSVFGSQGSGSFMTKSTGVLATIFFMCSLSLAYLSGQSVKKSSSVMDNVTNTQVETFTDTTEIDTVTTPSNQTEADVPSIPSPFESTPSDAGEDKDVPQQ